jgi:molecular chaperone GrpE (heat shock protein)
VKSFQIRSLCEKHGVNARAGRSDPVPKQAWDVQHEGAGSEDKNSVLRVANTETEELLRCKVTRLEATVRSLVCAVGVEQHARAEDEKLRKRLQEELQAAQSARTAAECACQVSLCAQLLSNCMCWSASIPACFP